MASYTGGSSVVRVNSLISLVLPELRGFRDAKGRFTSAQNAMRERNGRYAEGLQDRVVHAMEAKIAGYKRAGASTGRLLKVTADPANVSYDTFRIGVGNEAFLDNSIAKYWRTFEEGSASWGFAGTQLKAKGSRPPYPVAHGAVPGIRTTRSSLPWMDGKRFVVKHEIAPRNVYRDTVRGANPREFGRKNARRFLSEVLGRDLR